MAGLQLRGVYKRYGEKEVVKDVNLDIEDGDFLVLVGPSGCGKSTTLRMIAGLEQISAGELRIDDVVVNKMSPRDRNVAMVFQSYALYPHMTVYENISFGLQLAKMPKDEIDKRVQEVAKTLELTDQLTKKPKEMSGGQRQRVAMGRAIVRDPAVFLFDEPLSNLDAKLRVQMRAEIAKLHQRLGTTIVYVTHDQVEAMTLARHIVVMSEGVVQQVGAPLELYRRPANKFVGGFIGSPSMNFLDVKLTGGQLVGEGLKIPLPEHMKSWKLSAGQELTLGVRPEHMYRAEPGDDFAFDGVADVLEPVGADLHVLGKLGEQRFTARFDPEAEVEVGAAIRVGLEAERLQLFDRASEASLRPAGE